MVDRHTTDPFGARVTANVSEPAGGDVPADPRAAASDHAALLATKLFVPRAQPGFVPRRRLTEQLSDGLRRGFVLLCAPAGFGKTSLLADWSRASERSVAWLSLDGGDNDAARFWRHAAAALDGACPGIAKRVAPLLGPPSPASFEGFVTALVNGLTAQCDAVVLILDDYHVIESDTVHGSLMFLLEHLPPALRVAVASRSDPPLALARLRGRGQLAEVRAADLRFTADEATALLRAAVGRDLPDDAVGVLTDRTEGWVTGLLLAGLSLRRQDDPSGFVARFSGSHRYVLDYLTEEVLDQQPQQGRAFLLETSVLRRLSGALCDAVTGRTDGQAMLERVERANLFLAPLDDVRRWWRYHPLFADMLRARLQRDAPGRAPELHMAAAAWFDRQGYADEAVHHAVAARNHAVAAEVVERHIDELLLRSEGTTVQRWLAALPSDVVRTRPRLLLAEARLALLGGRVEAAEAALDAAERAWDQRAGEDDARYEASTGPAASLLVNIPATIAVDRAYLAELRGDVRGAIASASRAKARINPDEWMLRSHADGYLAVAKLLDGRLDEAERALSSIVATWRGAGERYLAVRGCHHLGQVQRAQGRLDAAVDTYRRALDLAAGTPAAGIAHVGLAEVAYQRNQLASALTHLDDGIPLCRQLVYTQPLATGLATLAWVRQAQGDTAAAPDLMGQAARVTRDVGAASVLNPVPVQRLRLLLARGDVGAATRWIEQRGLSIGDDPAYVREPEHLLLAQLLLARGRPDEALTLLERLVATALAEHRTGSLIELRAMRALALSATGDHAGAVAALAETLVDACPQGYVRVFVDAGTPMRTLLGRLVTAQGSSGGVAGEVPFDCLARLQHAFTATPALHHGAQSAAAAGMVDSLTAREREVLALMARGDTNAAIAGELVISLDTVKKHVSRVLDKLGAINRTEAVDRARKLGLIP